MPLSIDVLLDTANTVAILGCLVAAWVVVCAMWEGRDAR